MYILKGTYKRRDKEGYYIMIKVLVHQKDTTIVNIYVPNTGSLILEVGLKLNVQKTKIMASGPITSWEIDGETVQAVSDFIFWGS